ncbi:MAG: fumarate reductase subunit FrdD [Gammaproteobacteria bacterium]|jgi:fumarate reductase subunit D|nr:fumarate reductase subunit FrdD [Gammaproteobacteria bacterium]
MRRYQRSHEPVVWALFGAGGMVAAFLLPVLMLFTGVLVPLGIVDSATLSYARVQAFAEHWLGGLVVVGVIGLSAWHALHRIFHSLNDLKVGARRLRFMLCYGLAAAITVAAGVLVLAA